MTINIIVLGASSGIAIETARIWAGRGARLFLFARHNQKLDAVAQDLRARGATSVSTAVADLDLIEDHGALLDRAWKELGEVQTVFVAYGSLPDQALCENDSLAALKALHNNFSSVACLCLEASKRLIQQGAGTLAVITSVAGDRGRQSNFIYGSAKGALSIFLAGLRNKLCAKGIRVVTLKPGFVDTPMTAHLKKGPLFASAAQVARGIVRAIERGPGEAYLPWFWWPIMQVIKLIPEPIFKRMKL